MTAPIARAPDSGQDGRRIAIHDVYLTRYCAKEFGVYHSYKIRFLTYILVGSRQFGGNMLVTLEIARIDF